MHMPKHSATPRSLHRLDADENYTQFALTMPMAEWTKPAKARSGKAPARKASPSLFSLLLSLFV